MDTHVQRFAEARNDIRKRAFKPFRVWLPFALFLVIADVHLRLLRHTQIFFTVSVEGHSISDAYNAHLSFVPVKPGRNITPGWRTFRVAVEDAEPVEQRRFVWYGANNLGNFNLSAHKGTLEITADPAPSEVSITGRWFSGTLSNSPTLFSSVPVGHYQIIARYPWSREELSILVSRDRTNQISFSPEVGSLDLATQPAAAQFKLTSLNRNLIIDGQAPTQLRHLPAGEYALRVWRGDYLKQSRVEIKRHATNELAIVFEYGQVQIVSEPAGATVYDGTNAIGQTPKVFNELKPGRYRFRLEQPGYESAQVSFELRSGEPLTLRTNLVNIRFRDAMQNARRLVNGTPPNYPEALKNVAEALSAQPGDAEATELKSQLERDFQVYETRVAEEQKRGELEKRRRFVSDTFNRATVHLKDTGLFDTHVWTVSGRVADVRAALLRTFEKAPSKWAVESESAPDPESVIFHGKGKGVFAGRRSCIVLASQVTPEQVQVYAKFWDYALSSQISFSLLSGIDESSWVPVHPSRYSQPGLAEQRRQQLAEGFLKTLQNELR